ncbi:unnamed protein product [Echinostoma caproni]|uniref:Cadherin domain-containing protein n=1 Tax=Echinostoma caproni TaxID=27848 RepID=A0A183AVP8_9TREM|nr:unnamed protein product [Echinostoma caproni]
MYLGVNSQFTQQHIQENRLFYTFRRVLDDGTKVRAKDTVMDGFDFRVHVPGAQLKAVYHFQIAIRNSPDITHPHIRIHETVEIVQETARVLEGGTIAFRPDIFYAKQSECTPPNLGMYFQLLNLPDNGILQLRDEKNSSQTFPMKRFTFYSTDVIDKRLMVYQHDGSETPNDVFQYQFVCQMKVSMSTVQQSHSVGEPMVGTFRLDIVSVNDNPPVLNTQPLSVSFNQTTPISARWITILDQDTLGRGPQNDPKTFPLTWTIIPEFQRKDCAPYPLLGQFQNPITNRRVDSFSMDDVIRGNLSFLHMGLPKGKIKLHVTDGKFHSSSEVFINASKVVFMVVAPINPIVEDSEIGAPLFFEVRYYYIQEYNEFLLE